MKQFLDEEESRNLRKPGKAKNRKKLVIHNPEKRDPDAFGSSFRLAYKHELGQLYYGITGYFLVDDFKVYFRLNNVYDRSKTYYFPKTKDVYMYSYKRTPISLFSVEELEKKALDYYYKSDKKGTSYTHW